MGQRNYVGWKHSYQLIPLPKVYQSLWSFNSLNLREIIHTLVAVTLIAENRNVNFRHEVAYPSQVSNLLRFAHHKS